MMRYLGLFYFLCLFLLNQTVYAALFIDSVAIAPSTVAYKPSDSDLLVPITIVIRTNTNSNTNYFMVFNSTPVDTNTFARTATYASGTLTYSLFKTTGSTQPLKDLGYLSNSNHYLSGSIGNRASQTLTIWLKIPGGQFNTAGTYTNSVTAKLYRGTWTNSPPGSRLEDTFAFSVQIQMQKYFDIHLSKALSQLTLQGPIGNTASDTFSATYTTNTPSVVTLKSTNGEKLINGSYEIPYDVLVNNNAVTLPAGTEVNIDSTSVKIENRLITLRVQKLQTQIYEDGTYSDSLTLKVKDLF